MKQKSHYDTTHCSLMMPKDGENPPKSWWNKPDERVFVTNLSLSVNQAMNNLKEATEMYDSKEVIFHNIADGWVVEGIREGKSFIAYVSPAHRQ